MTDLERYNKDKASVMSMIKVILIVAISAVIIYFFTQIIAILIPFLIGFILAKTSLALASPLARFDKTPTKEIMDRNLTEHNKKHGIIYKIIHPNGIKPTKSTKTRLAIYIYVFLLIVLVLLVVWGIFSLISQGSTAIQKLANLSTNMSLSTVTDMVHNALHSFTIENGGFITAEMMASIDEYILSFFNSTIYAIPGIISSVLTWVWNMFESIPYGVFVVICVILSGYYFINDGPAVVKFYLKNVPNKSFRKKSLTLLNDLSVTLFRVVGGYMSLLIITLVESLIVFEIADLNYALIFAIITALLDFLPVLGISATMIPLMIYCFFTGRHTSIVILIIGMAIMTVIRRLIEPIILGKSMKVHPLLTLLGMIIGVVIWGPIGFLLGPTVMIIVIQCIKVFEIDKKFSAYLARVLAKLMKNPDDDDDDNGEDLRKKPSSRKRKTTSTSTNETKNESNPEAKPQNA